jgi:hypothetical protein
LKALEFTLQNEHLFYNSVECATSVLGNPVYTNVKLFENHEIKSNGVDMTYVRFQTSPSDFKIGLYSLLIFNKEQLFTTVYDYDNCLMEREANPLPWERDSCWKSPATKNFEMYIEKNTPIYMGFLTSQKTIKFSLVLDELEQMKDNQGSIQFRPVKKYKPFFYQSDGAIGHLLVKAASNGSRIIIYHDSEQCNGIHYSKLPRLEHNCEKTHSMKGKAAIYVKVSIDIINYFGFEGYGDSISFQYELIPPEALQINSPKLVEFKSEITNAFILDNDGSNEIVIKVLNTNPLNECQIHVDYEGCRKSAVEKMPDNKNYCRERRRGQKFQVFAFFCKNLKVFENLKKFS